MFGNDDSDYLEEFDDDPFYDSDYAYDSHRDLLDDLDREDEIIEGMRLEAREAHELEESEVIDEPTSNE
jgi:hypothetical protein